MFLKMHDYPIEHSITTGNVNKQRESPKPTTFSKEMNGIPRVMSCMLMQ